MNDRTSAGAFQAGRKSCGIAGPTGEPREDSVVRHGYSWLQGRDCLRFANRLDFSAAVRRKRFEYVTGIVNHGDDFEPVRGLWAHHDEIIPSRASACLSS